MCTSEANWLQFYIYAFRQKLWSNLFPNSIVLVNHQRNIFGFYFEFEVMISVVGVDNGSVQVLPSVLVARDDVALLVWWQDLMNNSVSGIFTRVVFLLDRWWRLYVLCPFIWLIAPAWDAVELTLRGWLHFCVHGLRPYWFKSNYELLFPEKCLETSHPSKTQIICLWWFIIKANVLVLLVNRHISQE